MTDSSKAVFLSYASQDAEAAKRICDALRAAGESNSPASTLARSIDAVGILPAVSSWRGTGAAPGINPTGPRL